LLFINLIYMKLINCNLYFYMYLYLQIVIVSTYLLLKIFKLITKHRKM
jgi:hypothetical protein